MREVTGMSGKNRGVNALAWLVFGIIVAGIVYTGMVYFHVITAIGGLP